MLTPPAIKRFESSSSSSVVKTPPDFKNQPETTTIQEKTEKILKFLVNEGIKITPQLRTILWGQLKENYDNTNKIKIYLESFKKFNLKPFVNFPRKLNVYTRPNGEDAIKKIDLPNNNHNIYFIPTKAYEALFPEAPWDRYFFKTQNWVSCVINRSAVEECEIPNNEIVNRVVKLAYASLSEGTQSLLCFAFEKSNNHVV